MTITTSYDQSGWKFDAAVLVDRNDATPSGDVKAGSTYAGKAVQFMHVGEYDKIGDTTQKAYAWLAVQGYKAKDRLIEEYISDPGNTPWNSCRRAWSYPYNEVEIDGDAAAEGIVTQSRKTRHRSC